jgi:hypothetical protein
MAKTQRINITLPTELRTKIDESPYGLTETIVKALERFFKINETTNSNKGIEKSLEARIESLERQLETKDNQIKKLENILENQTESLRQLLYRSQESTLFKSKPEDISGLHVPHEAHLHVIDTTSVVRNLKESHNSDALPVIELEHYGHELKDAKDNQEQPETKIKMKTEKKKTKKEPRKCALAECNNIFTPNKSNQIYCCPQHSGRGTMRKSREKKMTAKLTADS